VGDETVGFLVVTVAVAAAVSVAAAVVMPMTVVILFGGVIRTSDVDVCAIGKNTPISGENSGWAYEVGNEDCEGGAKAYLHHDSVSFVSPSARVNWFPGLHW